jgi:hypothetical protein
MCPIGYDDSDDVFVKGNTDGTKIGNVADRLKVDAVFSTAPTVTDQEFPTFVVCINSIATANNKSMLSLVNASESTVSLKIRDVRWVNSQNTAVTGVVADFQLFRCGSHSAGTAITPLAHDTADTLDSHITARTGATIGTEGASCLKRWKWSTDEWSQGAEDVESHDHVVQTLTSLYAPVSKTKPITLRAGEGVTFKCVTNTTTGVFDILVTFTQE